MIQLEELLAVGGQLRERGSATSWSDWCYDSRLAEPGQCFVALRTERRDGHAFIPDAVERGCSGVLCVEPPSDVGAMVVQVPDVRLALQRWASERIERINPRIVAVTGSVGKTSTKRAIATLLAGAGQTFSSRRSFNSLLGLPLAMAQLEAGTRFAVLEMGVDRFGEMARLAELFPPRTAVVTNVAPTHLQYLRDETHIAAEKSALVQALPPDGWAVLNADDPRVVAMATQTKANIMWYSACEPLRAAASPELNASPQPLLRASDIVVEREGTRFVLHWGDIRLVAHIPLLGFHHAYTALAAVAVALLHGMELTEAVERLRLVEPLAGRLRPLKGVHGSIILDDSYNASPRSTLAALDTLRELPVRRRIAVFGPMLELGEATEQWHREVGARAAEVCDLVVTVGELAARMAPSTVPPANVGTATFSLEASTDDAIAVVRPRLGPGDAVLVKGSAAARMEQVVRRLLAPEVPAEQVLVRQEATWERLRVAAEDRPTWLEIDLQAIANNVREIKRIVGPRCQIMGVLKADAYGHGAVHTARTVLQHGATYLAVATLGEARKLREARIAAPILILGYTPPWQVREALRSDVQLAVFDVDVARELSLAAEELRRTAQVHLKVDTGMGRLGTEPNAALPLLQLLRDLPGVEAVGLFTHLATADSADATLATEQLQRWEALLDEVTRAGLRPPLVHAANGPTILRYPSAHYDLVRPGLLMYGLHPSPETPCPPQFRPALQWKTEVAQVKIIPAGASVSYGATWIAPRPSRIATIPVGYADGFRRSPSWREVLVRGQRAPLVGRVCMDYTMLDVSEVPGVRGGDEVVLIGSQGDDRITVEEVATWLGTINYEVIASILPRVPRIV